MTDYPYNEGDVTVLGPEIFASRDGAIICWRGENYDRQSERLEARLAQAERALEVVEWLVAMDEPGNPDRQTVTLTQIINRAAAAIREGK